MGAYSLVLNASYEPLHIVSWQRALQLLFQGKVEVVENSDNEIRTVRFTMKVPAVLRLIRYITSSHRKQVLRFSRANVFLRDDFTCQYCGQKFQKQNLTLDHVVPVVQGGKKSWENIVTSCIICNQKKGGRTPTQASMFLVKKPVKPKWLPMTHIHFGFTVIPERWKVYLYLEK